MEEEWQLAKERSDQSQIKKISARRGKKRQ